MVWGGGGVGRGGGLVKIGQEGVGMVVAGHALEPLQHFNFQVGEASQEMASQGDGGAGCGGFEGGGAGLGKGKGRGWAIKEGEEGVQGTRWGRCGKGASQENMEDRRGYRSCLWAGR